MRRLTLCLCLAWMTGVPSSSEADRLSLRDKLAIVLVGEADGSGADWSALLWTLKHRADKGGYSLYTAAEYSVVLRANKPRARRIRSLATDNPDWGDAAVTRKRQWQRAHKVIDQFLRGDLHDTCGRAMHWRGPNDPIPSRDRTVLACGPTRNEFFYYSPKRTES